VVCCTALSDEFLRFFFYSTFKNWQQFLVASFMFHLSYLPKWADIKFKHDKTVSSSKKCKILWIESWYYKRRQHNFFSHSNSYFAYVIAIRVRLDFFKQFVACSTNIQKIKFIGCFKYGKISDILRRSNPKMRHSLCLFYCGYSGVQLHCEIKFMSC
jgi:hypothetical protein